MQSDIFAQAAPLLEEIKTDVDRDRIFSFLNKYHPGEYIYPGAMHRELGISIPDAYSILELCAENGLVDPKLELYCPRCQRFTGNIYSTVFDIPEFISCIHCDEPVESPINHAIVIYQVKR